MDIHDSLLSLPDWTRKCVRNLLNELMAAIRSAARRIFPDKSTLTRFILDFESVTSEANEIFDSTLPADRASDKRSGKKYKFRAQQADISALQQQRLRKGIKWRSIGNP